MKKIKSQQEANGVFEFLVKVTMDTMKIDRDQAEKRMRRLLDSGDLNGLTPKDVQFQMKVDAYMSTPA